MPATPASASPRRRKIRQTLEDAAPLIVSKTLGAYKNVLNEVRSAFADRDAAGRVPADL
jgi:glucarate dehydratase